MKLVPEFIEPSATEVANLAGWRPNGVCFPACGPGDSFCAITATALSKHTKSTAKKDRYQEEGEYV